jgi:hypothetical protein
MDAIPLPAYLTKGETIVHKGLAKLLKKPANAIDYKYYMFSKVI